MDKCERSKLVHLFNQTTPESNGEGWEEVEMAKIGTLYFLPFIIGVLMCEVGEFFGGRGIRGTIIEKLVLLEWRLNLNSSN